MTVCSSEPPELAAKNSSAGVRSADRSILFKYSISLKTILQVSFFSFTCGEGFRLIGLFLGCILWYVIQCDEDEANPTSAKIHTTTEPKLICQTVHFGQRGQAGVHPQEGPERRGHQVCPPGSFLPRRQVLEVCPVCRQ